MALPDDDGTQQAEVAQFKRKRRLRLAGLGVVVGGIIGVAVYLLTSYFFPSETTEEHDLAQVQRCDMTRMTEHSDQAGHVPAPAYVKGRCNKLLAKLLRRLFREPKLCDRIARKIATVKDWERKNRLLHVLLRYRRALYPDTQKLNQQELRRQPCIEEPVVQMVRRWSTMPGRNRSSGSLIPGVAKYNLNYLLHLRFLVTKAYVLKRAPLPPPMAKRLAAHLEGQFRILNQAASPEMQESIKKVYGEIFYPLWARLGKPEPTE